ncbi:MAG: heavy-metal-associated domain-containing protein [Pseudomonadales bacterium]
MSTEVAGETVLIPVEGMSCVVCAASVKNALQSIDGVQEAEIDLERREARVRYVEGKVSPEQLVAAINQLGYKAGAPAPETP